MSKLFISYRRSDTEQIAGRIVERLSKRFGVGSIFFDMDSIPVGDDYREHLNSSMRQCQVLLALIGEKWIEKGTLGEPRILNTRDPVRIEIESAFENQLIELDKRESSSEKKTPNVVKYREKIFMDLENLNGRYSSLENKRKEIQKRSEAKIIWNKK